MQLTGKKITRKIFTISILLLFFLLINNSHSVLAGGMIGHWHFAGNSDDLSGNGLDGTLFGTYDISNGYFETNGAGYMRVNDNDLLSFGNGTTDLPFSISAWIYMTDATNFPIVTKGLSSTAEYVFSTYFDDILYFTVIDASLGNTHVGRAVTNMTDYENEWIHVVATYDGTANGGNFNSVNIYVNGIESDDSDYGSNMSNYVAMENHDDYLYMGQYLIYKMKGRMDELKIYNYELDSAEVLDLFQSQEGIYRNKSVFITAAVDPTLSFNLSSTACDLGTFSSSKIVTCGYNAIIDTNATNGYSAYIREDDDLKSAAGDVIADVATAESVTPGGDTAPLALEQYGISTSQSGQTITENTTGASCSNLDIGGTQDGDTAMPATALSTTDKRFASASGPASAESTELCHAAAVLGSTPAGVYAHTVTITVVGNF